MGLSATDTSFGRAVAPRGGRAPRPSHSRVIITSPAIFGCVTAPAANAAIGIHVIAFMSLPNRTYYRSLDLELDLGLLHEEESGQGFLAVGLALRASNASVSVVDFLRPGWHRML